MKRIIAMLLSLVLCCGAMAPMALAADEDAVTEVQETGEAAPETAGEETPAEPEPDAPGTLSFANLETRVRENNVTVRMLQETIASINAIDFDDMKDEVRQGLNDIARAQFGILTMGQYTGESIAADLAFNTMQSSYDALRETFDDLKDGSTQKDYADTVRQLENTQNQVVIGAESLYIALLEMQNSRNTLDRTLASTNRMVQEMQLRYKLGQISALQLHQATNGLDKLRSGISTLDMNLNNYTAQMELMVGVEQTGSLILSEVPDVTAEQVAAMDYEKDLAAAKEKSYELYDAKSTLDDAEDDYETEIDKYGPASYKRAIAEHTWQAAQYTYQSAVQNFELKFRTMFNAVADYQQILASKESDLSLQQDIFQAEELKYQQGKISKNAYLDAQDDLESARTDVITAKHNLFTAYRTYQWAVDYGVLN